MIQKKLSWKSQKGISIYGNLWQPENSPKTIVVLVHGFGEHCMRYSPYIKLFTDNEIAFIGYDHVGHGQSGGKRGIIFSYEQLLDDVDLCLKKAEELFPEIPKFIYGHSMGGNIALNFLLKRKPKVNGAIISSPWLRLTKPPGIIVEKLVTFLSLIVPNITIKSGLDNNDMSSDSNEVELYEKDELNHGRISFRLFSEITKNGKRAMKLVENLNIPTKLIHGNADQVTSFKASEQTSQKSKEIEFEKWEGGYHELHNEVFRKDVAISLIKWIENKL